MLVLRSSVNIFAPTIVKRLAQDVLDKCQQMFDIIVNSQFYRDYSYYCNKTSILETLKIANNLPQDQNRGGTNGD